MITPKQLKILGACTSNVFKEYTFKELKALSNEKSNSALQNAVARFRLNNLVHERKIGASKLYSLNLNNEAVYSYLQIIFECRMDKIAAKTITLLKSEIEKHTLFYSIVVFGSYANQSRRKNSDLDVVIMIPDKTQEKNVNVCLNSVMNKSLVELDAHIITQSDFLKMLAVDYENLGKQIARKNMPVHNAAIFYGLVKRGIAHGFRY